MIEQFQTPRDFLKAELARRVGVNSRYSIRAFARHMGVRPGELSEILSGKRGLSLRSAEKVANALGLSESEKMHLIQIAQMQKYAREEKTNTKDLDEQPFQLTQDLFEVVSDWYCFAILNLVETKGFRWDAKWIAKRLGITPAQATIGMDRLERLELVERDERNPKKIKSTNDYVFAQMGVPSEAVRNYHRQILKKALESLDFDPIESREVIGISLSIDSKNIPQVKKEMTRFLEKTLKKYQKGIQDEVYHLEMALLPLSKIENKNGTIENE